MLKFAAGSLSVVSRLNTLSKFVFDIDGTPHDIDFFPYVILNMEELLNSQGSLRSLSVSMESYDEVMRLTPAFAPQFKLESLSITSNIKQVNTPPVAPVIADPGLEDVTLTLQKLLSSSMNSCTNLNFMMAQNYMSMFCNSLVQMTRLKVLKFESNLTSDHSLRRSFLASHVCIAQSQKN